MYFLRLVHFFGFVFKELKKVCFNYKSHLLTGDILFTCDNFSLSLALLAQSKKKQFCMSLSETEVFYHDMTNSNIKIIDGKPSQMAEKLKQF